MGWIATGCGCRRRRCCASAAAASRTRRRISRRRSHRRSGRSSRSTPAAGRDHRRTGLRTTRWSSPAICAAPGGSRTPAPTSAARPGASQADGGRLRRCAGDASGCEGLWGVRGCGGARGLHGVDIPRRAELADGCRLAPQRASAGLADEVNGPLPPKDEVNGPFTSRHDGPAWCLSPPGRPASERGCGGGRGAPGVGGCAGGRGTRLGGWRGEEGAGRGDGRDRSG